MVNYEAVIIETNQELINQGKEPLYVVYPKNGLTISDNTLAYINNGEGKRRIFYIHADFLLTKDTQEKMAELGRRTGFGGVMKNADPNVFNPDWGI